MRWLIALFTGNLYELHASIPTLFGNYNYFWIYYSLIKTPDYPDYHCFETTFKGDAVVRTVSAEQYTKAEAWKIARKFFRGELPVS